MANGTGSLSWASATGGRLNRQDHAYLLGQALLTRLSRLPRSVRRALGFSDNRPFYFDLDQIIVPDSAAAKQTEDHVAALSPPWLTNHCQRTYVWGTILAQKDGVAFDPELFYIVSLLHDLGLTAEHHGCNDKAACFAVEGGWAAGEFARKLPWADERADRLAEAITLHLNVSVGLEHGAEAYLLRQGSALDVAGLRYHEIDISVTEQILRRHPRLAAKEGLIEALSTEARLRPQSRTAFLKQNGFLDMITQAPFAS